ncbi:MAG: DUF167 domain-containing protein [Chitinispirillaceae bacterium]|nr:DUF167 domain-containing protein [Chitinispirillaceae bacterium]
MREARLQVRLKPRAKNDRVRVADGGLLDVGVTSPPVDERANAHLVELLAKRLDVPKRMVTIIVGGHGRNKVVRVEGVTKKEVIDKLTVAG